MSNLQQEVHCVVIEHGKVWNHAQLQGKEVIQRLVLQQVMLQHNVSETAHSGVPKHKEHAAQQLQADGIGEPRNFRG